MKADEKFIKTRLQALLASGFADKAVQDQEVSKVARRSELIAKRHGIASKHAKGYVALTVAVDKADQEKEKARAELETKIQSYRQAHAALMNESFQRSREEAALERELEETADPQINQYLDQLHAIANQARFAVDLPTVDRYLDLGGTVVLERSVPADYALPTQAMAALEVALHTARALKQQALTTAEVTKALRLIGQRLEEALTPISLCAPLVCDGGIGAPPAFAVRGMRAKLEATDIALH